MPRKKDIGLSEEKRSIIGQLISMYDIKTAQDIQDALKDLLGGTIQSMLLYQNRYSVRWLSEAWRKRRHYRWGDIQAERIYQLVRIFCTVKQTPTIMELFGSRLRMTILTTIIHRGYMNM